MVNGSINSVLKNYMMFSFKHWMPTMYIRLVKVTIVLSQQQYVAFLCISKNSTPTSVCGRPRGCSAPPLASGTLCKGRRWNGRITRNGGLESKRSSHEPQMPTVQCYYGICILWGSFEDPQMDPQRNLKCSEGSFYYDFRITFECACLFLYDPQTILKCVWATFCNDFQRFWGTETWDLYNTKGLSLKPCAPPPSELRSDITMTSM